MSRARREIEEKICGEHACRALFARRREDVIRVYLLEDRIPRFGDLLHHCARVHRPYKVVPPAELEAISGGSHHEGICVVAKPRAPTLLEDLLRTPGSGLLLGLAGVANPHNVGAILRAAANFGVRGVLVPPEAARLPPATLRTAQGGAEWVPVVGVEDLGRALRAARAAGFAVAGSSSHAGRDLFEAPLPPRLLLLLGAEDEGLDPETSAAADVILRIPGTGCVESLNVAAAAGVLLAEHWRQHRVKPAPARKPPPPAKSRRES